MLVARCSFLVLGCPAFNGISAFSRRSLSYFGEVGSLQLALDFGFWIKRVKPHYDSMTSGKAGGMVCEPLNADN